MSKVCKHCDLAWNDKSPTKFCICCGRTLVHVDDNPEDYRPVNKKHIVATCLWLIMLALSILLSLSRNYHPCIDMGYWGYFKKTLSGSFVLVGDHGASGRIDVSNEGEKSIFSVDYLGEKYTAELRWTKTSDGKRIAHIRYSDGEYYSGIYNSYLMEPLYSSKGNDDWENYRLCGALCLIDQEDWDYRGSPSPIFAGGIIYVWGLLSFAAPDFANALASKNKPIDELTDRDRKAYHIGGVVMMLLGIAVMMIVTDKVPHGRFFL